MACGEALKSFSDDQQTPWQVLEPGRVDRPGNAGDVDSLECIPADDATLVSDPSFLFPNGTPRVTKLPRCLGTSQMDYVAHTANLMQCGKVRLRLLTRAAASVFAVGKRGKTSQREVWSGGLVSDHARRPPKPPRLGNPAMFAHIVKEPGRSLVFAKRDAKAFFDQLRLPEKLRPYFGRPRVQASELATALGCAVGDLSEWIDDLGKASLKPSTMLTPVNTVWPMGFSWSSFIAQSVMVAACLDAGIDEQALLCLEEPPPAHSGEWVTVATDDVIMVHDSKEGSRSCTQRLDAALARRGIEKNSTKDVDAAERVEALGCELGNDPPWVEPALMSFSRGLYACIDLADHGRASPKMFSRLLGLLQWFAQPSRWLFSIFDRAYRYRNAQPEDTVTEVPADAANECLLFLALSPLASVSMERRFLELVTACDASPAYGFGVAVKACDLATVRRLAAQSSQLDRYLSLDGITEGFEHKPAYGSPVQLKAELGDFTPVLSIKARRHAHSGELEAHGLLLLTQWVARTATRHSSRVVVAIDARAVLGAARKGRSSAPTLKRAIMRVAATCLAADLQLMTLWVPSAHNPADAPSRGKRLRSTTPNPDKVRKALLKQPILQAFHRCLAAERRLVDISSKR